eukprot:351134-Chlamydomonas_euryale.AAC.8
MRRQHRGGWAGPATNSERFGRTAARVGGGSQVLTPRRGLSGGQRSAAVRYVRGDGVFAAHTSRYVRHARAPMRARAAPPLTPLSPLVPGLIAGARVSEPDRGQPAKLQRMPMRLLSCFSGASARGAAGRKNKRDSFDDLSDGSGGAGGTGAACGAARFVSRACAQHGDAIRRHGGPNDEGSACGLMRAGVGEASGREGDGADGSRGCVGAAQRAPLQPTALAQREES